MANIPVPTIAIVTPTPVDTVLGVQAGLVKRFTVSQLQPTAETLAGTALAPNVMQASLNQITPVGGILNITGTVIATVPDEVTGMKQVATTGVLRYRPYVASLGGAIIEATNAAESDYIDMSLTARALKVSAGGVQNVTTTTGAGFAVNGTLTSNVSLRVGGAVRQFYALVNPGQAAIRMAAGDGGWASEFAFLSATAGTTMGAFGGYGGSKDTLDYLWCGPAYNNYWANLTSIGLNVAGVVNANCGLFTGSLVGALVPNSIGIDAAGGTPRILAIGADGTTAGTLKLSVVATDADPYVDVATVTSAGVAITGNLQTTQAAVFGSGVAPGTRSATFASTTGDRMRVYSQVAGSGIVLDAVDPGETTTNLPFTIGSPLHATAGLVVTGGTLSSTGELIVANTGPIFKMQETDGAVNAKNWGTLVDGGSMYFRLVNDDYSGGNVWLTATRTGFASATIGLTGNTTVVGTLTASDSLFLGSFLQIGAGANFATGIDIGYTGGSATTPYIDFHSGATAVDFDARIIGGGGTGVNGGGTLTISAAGLVVSGNLVASGSVVRFAALPTSSAGLSAGDLWNDSGTVKIT